MAKLSSAAWIAHDVGLATALGGTLFGREALHPALREGIDDQLDRDRVADTAWRRFSWINLAAHGAMAATWFAGRTMLSGREVTRSARPLTVAKDALIVASLATGLASVVLGRILGKRVRNQVDEARAARAGRDAAPRGRCRRPGQPRGEHRHPRHHDRAVDAGGEVAEVLASRAGCCPSGDSGRSSRRSGPTRSACRSIRSDA